MMKINSHQAGLTLGIFFGFCHFAWVLAVLTNVAQTFVDWSYSLHFINNPPVIGTAEPSKVIIGLISAFLAGYFIGGILSYIWNVFEKMDWKIVKKSDVQTNMPPTQMP